MLKSSRPLLKQFQIVCSFSMALMLLFALTCSVSCNSEVQSQPNDAELNSILKHMEQKIYGNTSYSRIEIGVHKKRVNRTMQLDSWEDRKADKMFMRILAPKRDRGVTFLKWGNNLWQYTPRLGKEIKIEGSLMQDNWMGSDFSNDDLMRANSLSEDYTARLLPSKNATIYIMELKPKAGAPIVWSKLVLELRKNDLMPLSQDFYDHRDRLVRRLEYSKFKIMDGQKMPTYYRVASMQNGKETSYTTLNFLTVRFNQAIPSRIFSKANLRR